MDSTPQFITKARAMGLEEQLYRHEVYVIHQENCNCHSGGICNCDAVLIRSQNLGPKTEGRAYVQ